jgi:hypothetical protein
MPLRPAHEPLLDRIDYRSTFEDALHRAVSTADFMPDAVDRFLQTAPR